MQCFTEWVCPSILDISAWTIEHEMATRRHCSARNDPSQWTSRPYEKGGTDDYRHGRDRAHRQEDLAATLAQAGFSGDVARSYVELVHALNERIVTSIEGRTAANTTPTRFEEFAVELAEQFARA